MIFTRNRPGIYCPVHNCVHDSGAVCGPVAPGKPRNLGLIFALVCGAAMWAAVFKLCGFI